MPIAEVSLPIPLRKSFDYLIPETLVDQLMEWQRVGVKFGSRPLIGVVIRIKQHSDFSSQQIKSIDHLIDKEPVFNNSIFSLVKWLADYYQAPLGEVIQLSLPVLLRQGKAADFPSIDHAMITELGKSFDTRELNRGIRQQQALDKLKQKESLPLNELYLEQGITRQTLNALEKKGLINFSEKKIAQDSNWQLALESHQQKLTLTKEQAVAVAAINQAKGFSTFLLEGVTGSGKTEVYLQCLEPILAAGKQALVLVPEIGLTPQTIQRFKDRFNLPIHVLHSKLTDSERLNSWLNAKHGSAAIIIGTRSAIFSQLKNPGIIIIDEEHDGSYKQQDGVRYHARDLAVMRAKIENIPLVLGSATPSFETLQNAIAKKYIHLQLTSRAGGAVNAKYQLLNMKHQPAEQTISEPLKLLMEQHLADGNQVLLFLNRRGYAPLLMCHDCGWVAECQNCDMSFTVHKRNSSIVCHHCGSIKRLPEVCNDCHSSHLVDFGEGTEKLEDTVAAMFAEYSILRIDSDNTRRKGQLEKYLNEVQAGKHQILIGTQMLAKGHHFPNVTLVAMIDVDGSLYSQDFRAQERFAQLYTQVSGRAGRASKPGLVALQTYHPENELLQDLLNNGYGHFARFALRERKQAMLPPFSYQALFRTEASNAKKAEQLLQQIKQLFEKTHSAISLLGPFAAPIEKRAGKYRFQLLLQCSQRSHLQAMLKQVMPQIEVLKSASNLRWSIDVDPMDMF